jgi:hypothetical protein
VSRAKIGGVAAGVVVVLTAAAYLLASDRLETGIRNDAESRLNRANRLLAQISTLESVEIIAHAKSLAEDRSTVQAIAQADASVRDQDGRAAIQSFLDGLKKGRERVPDFVAVVDGAGTVLFADSPLPERSGWKRFKSVAAAVDAGQVSKDTWEYGNRTVRVGVAPVSGPGPAGLRAAVVVGYAANDDEAQQHAAALGADVVLFSGERIRATSFRRAGDADELSRQPVLRELESDALAGRQVVRRVPLGGETYLAVGAPVPVNFSDRASGQIVMQPLSAAMGPVSTVRMTIVLLGVGALLVALLVMMVTTRVLLHPAEEIELGVTEIINGNVDYTFRPAGKDFDGLANALNVMLARLLGRPEPGEDEPGDENDSGAGAGKVLLEDELGTQAALGGARSLKDSDSLALAQEPEAEYHRRLFTEYLAARKGAGENVDGVTFESFVAKLRLSEANLRTRYNCRVVRFRVQLKNGQVSLKPVPIE